MHHEIKALANAGLSDYAALKVRPRSNFRQTSAGTSYGHSGFSPGYLTDMMYFPEHKIAIAVQVNTSVGQSLGKPLGRVITEAVEVIRKQRSQ